MVAMRLARALRDRWRRKDCRPSDCHCTNTPCGDCEFINFDAARIGYCFEGLNTDPVVGLCEPGVDGTICVYVSDGLNQPYWGDVAYDFGVLLAQNGYADHVRYADMGRDGRSDSESCIVPCSRIKSSRAAARVARVPPAAPAAVAPLHPVGSVRPITNNSAAPSGGGQPRRKLLHVHRGTRGAEGCRRHRDLPAEGGLRRSRASDTRRRECAP